MHRILFFPLVALLGAMMLLAQEQKVKAKDVPAPVVAAAAKAFPKATVKGWSKEVEDGKTQYEASMTEGAVKRDVIFAADGKLVLVEEAIATAALPPAVSQAVKAKYPQGVIQLAEKLIKDGEVQYEVHLKKAAKKEMLLTAAGKIVKEE